jgi:hypothetical protein
MNGAGIRKVCYRSTDTLNNVQSIQTSADFTVSNSSYYADSDGDGYGNPSVSVNACATPVGYVIDNTDCDDTDALEFPGQVWYLDADTDGWSAS